MSSQLELVQRPFIELQIEAMVEENVIKPRRVINFIDKLESRIVSINSVNYDRLLNKTLKLPFIGRPNPQDEDYPKNFKFVPPQKLTVIGGFKTLTAIKRANYVDLAIALPSQLLKKKDIKNQKYHHKRALYLAQLAQLLKTSIGDGLIEELRFRYQQGDFLKPVLLITPKCPKLKSADITFQLFVYPEEDSMKLSMLHPAHGNLAPRWFFKDYPLAETDSDMQEFLQNDSDATASPFYNSSILFDIEMIANSSVLFEQIKSHASIAEALVLAKIWLYQRELHSHFSFIISMYMAYLQTQQIIHQNMSSYQIFKTTIKSLATSDWIEAGLSYFEDSKNKIAAFKLYFPVVFLSPSGHLNLCYNITEDLYNRLKHESLVTQSVLNSSSSNTFELIFLKKMSFVNKFDVIVHLPKCTKKLPLDLEFLKKFMDHGIFIPRVYSPYILNIVKTGLTDRVVLVQQSSEHLLMDKSWSLNSTPYDPSNEDSTFTFGLLLEPEKSLRIIDVGPEAQSEEAEKFRKFWDPKCQLRLQNGTISETVVWHVDRFSKRRAIIKYILTHAMKKNNIHNIVVHYTLLERFISLQNVFFRWRDESNSNNQAIESENNVPTKRKRFDDAKHMLGVGEEVFQRLLNAYNEFNKVVRSIENMKHLITSVQPVSQHLRSSAVFPPLPVSLQFRISSLKRRKGVTLFPEDFDEAGKILYIEPIDILLTLESTGNWPNELEAFEAAKQEYLIQLGEALKEKDYSVKFAVNYLDVLHGQFVFRLRVKCSKHLSLVSTSCGKSEFQKTRMDLEIMPKVHAALDQLYREKPAFGLTCRLVKRWIYCHLLTDHFNEITLDLIVAHTFLNPQPYTEPSSSACGFRRFLMLVAQHDWKQLPLIVNFDNLLKLDEMNRLKDAMLEDRSKYPPMVIITPYEKELSPWTKFEPSMPMLDLLIRICNKAHQFICEDVLSVCEIADGCQALFRPNLNLFNLLINLHPKVVQNSFMSIDRSEGYKLSGREPEVKNSSAFRVMPIVGFSLIEQYVKLLRKNYDHVALFFYDKYGQRVIGVVLKPGWEKIFAGDIKKFIGEVKNLGSKLVESITIVKND